MENQKGKCQKSKLKKNGNKICSFSKIFEEQYLDVRVASIGLMQKSIGSHFQTTNL